MFRVPKTVGDLVSTLQPEQLEEFLLYIQQHTGIDIPAILKMPACRIDCLKCTHFHPIALSCLNPDIVSFDPRVCECREDIRNEPEPTCHDCALYDQLFCMCNHEAHEGDQYREPWCDACRYFNRRGGTNEGHDT